MGSLCSELDKRGDGLDRTCAQLLHLPIDWAEQQFREMGIGRPATLACGTDSCLR
jgi:hypothetical protein